LAELEEGVKMWVLPFVTLDTVQMAITYPVLRCMYYDDDDDDDDDGSGLIACE
jgi:hypothetical protein